MPTTEAKISAAFIEKLTASLPLASPRLRLRLPNPEDAAWIEPAVSNPQVSLMTGSIPHPYPAGGAHEWIKNARPKLATGAELSLIIEQGPGKIPMGVIGLRFSATEAEIGYWLAEEFWRKGYAREAVARLLAFAFDDLALTRITAGTFKENPASLAVQQKLGFRLLGEEEKEFSARGKKRHLVSAITRDDYTLQKTDGGCAAVTSDLSPIKMVLVSAAALIDRDGRVLLAQRPLTKPMGGLWEFPGGKVEVDETPEAALIRELKEELDIDTSASCLAPIAFASHRYPTFHLLMPLYACRVWRGALRPREGQNLAWVKPARLVDYPMPPADLPLIPLLRDLL